MTGKGSKQGNGGEYNDNIFIYAFCQTFLVFSLKEAKSIQNFAHKHP